MTDMRDLRDSVNNLSWILSSISESNKKSAASLLKIQQMMHALVWLVIIITLINIGFLIM